MHLYAAVSTPPIGKLSKLDEYLHGEKGDRLNKGRSIVNSRILLKHLVLVLVPRFESDKSKIAEGL